MERGLIYLFVVCLCSIEQTLSELSAESVFEILTHSISQISNRVGVLESDMKLVKDKIKNLENVDENENKMNEYLEQSCKELKKDFNEQRSAVYGMMSLEKKTIRERLDVEKENLRENVKILNQRFVELSMEIRSELATMSANFSKEFSTAKSEVESLAENTLNVTTHHLESTKAILLEMDNKLNATVEEFELDINATESLLRNELQSAEDRLRSSLDGQKADYETMIMTLKTETKDKTSALSSRISSESSAASSRISTLSSQYRTLSSQYSSLSSQYSSLSSSLSSKSSSLSSDISSLSSSISSLSSRISEEEERKVGFTAQLMNKRNYYGKSERIIFNNVYYNHGSGYSSSNGIFTAPKSGTYLFSYNVEASNIGKVHVVLKINGYNWGEAIINVGPNMNAGNTGVDYMHKGDTAWVQTASLESKYYLAPYRTQFTGVLID